jgi:hypothetical protein
MQIVMPFWHTIIVRRGLSHPTQKILIQTNRALNYLYYLQRADAPDRMGSIAF